MEESSGSEQYTKSMTPRILIIEHCFRSSMYTRTFMHMLYSSRVVLRGCPVSDSERLEESGEAMISPWSAWEVAIGGAGRGRSQVWTRPAVQIWKPLVAGFCFEPLSRRPHTVVDFCSPASSITLNLMNTLNMLLTTNANGPR